MRIVLLVNSTASKVTARDCQIVSETLRVEHAVDIVQTTGRMHASVLAREAADRGADVVAVLAGDGTLNEAADGLAHTDTALAPLPAGSTNVYARTLGVGKSPADAAAHLLASLRRRSFRRIGLGVANGRRFLFHSGIGFDAAVIKRVESRRPLKRYFAHPLYVLAALDTLARRYDRTRQRFEIKLANGETIERVGFAIVSKTSPYTYLGPRAITVSPEAGLDTPLALVAFQAMDGVTLFGATASSLLSGRFIARRAGIAHRSALSELTVTGPVPFPWQVDGDYVGMTTKLEFTYEPDVLELVVP